MFDLRSVLRLPQYMRDYDPNEMDLGQVMGGAQPPAPPPALAPPRAQAPPPGHDLTADDIPQPTEPTKGRKMAAMALAFMGADSDAVERFKNKESPETKSKRLLAKIAQAQRLFPGDETAQNLFVTNDPNFLKAIAGHYEDKVVASESGVARNGKEVYRNKKRIVGVDAGYGYTGDDEHGVTFGAQRGASHSEAETAEHNDAEEALKGQEIQQKTDEATDKNVLETEKSGEQRVITKAAREGYEALNDGERRIFDAWEANKKNGGGFQMPGVNVDTGGSDDAPAETSDVSTFLSRSRPGLQPSNRARNAPAQAPAAAAKPPQMKEGQTARIMGSDGKMHRWAYRGGQFTDLGLAQ